MRKAKDQPEKFPASEETPVDEPAAAPMGDNDIEEEIEPGEGQEETTEPEPPQQNINDFMDTPSVKAFIKKKIAEGVQEALRGAPPRANTASHSATEKDAFDRMTYRERLKLFQSDPQSYYKLREGN